MAMAVNSKTTIAAARTPVLRENFRRAWAVFINKGSEDISLLLGDQGADGDGIPMSPNGLYEINVLNYWNGPIYAICASGGMQLSWTEVSK